MAIRVWVKSWVLWLAAHVFEGGMRTLAFWIAGTYTAWFCMGLQPPHDRVIKQRLLPIVSAGPAHWRLFVAIANASHWYRWKQRVELNCLLKYRLLCTRTKLQVQMDRTQTMETRSCTSRVDLQQCNIQSLRYGFPLGRLSFF